MKIDKDYGLVSGGYELKLIANLNRAIKKRTKAKSKKRKRKYTRNINLGDVKHD